MASREAGDLRKLADDIRRLLDEPIALASDQNVPTEERWAGPNAERIRSELSGRKSKLAIMADAIEGEAANRKDPEGDGKGRR
ncbi:hypothetical protein ACFW17_29745 [Streptomyces sp. NPDC058961]|uniref:hypothetical protein n=1 Tax=unclassified Streptomyces TaxID=2593676 RepID=UPI00331FE0EE